MSADKDAINWVTSLVSILSVIFAVGTTVLARVFKSGRKESQFEGQDRILENMLTNIVKEQVALKENLKDSCKLQSEINLRLTKLEVQVSERDMYSRGRDPTGYGRFRDQQDRNKDG